MSCSFQPQPASSSFIVVKFAAIATEKLSVSDLRNFLCQDCEIRRMKITPALKIPLLEAYDTGF